MKNMWKVYNKTTADMPEELRKTFPDIEELKKLI